MGKKDKIFSEIEEIKEINLNDFREKLWNDKYSSEVLNLLLKDENSCYTNEPLVKIDTSAYLSYKESSRLKKSDKIANFSLIVAFLSLIVSIFSIFN